MVTLVNVLCMSVDMCFTMRAGWHFGVDSLCSERCQLGIFTTSAMHVSTNYLKCPMLRQRRESMLHQTLHERLASDIYKRFSLLIGSNNIVRFYQKGQITANSQIGS